MTISYSIPIWWSPFWSHGSQAVETRNFTGTQLIDRNDELCILWEKANIQVPGRFSALSFGWHILKKWLHDASRWLRLWIFKSAMMELKSCMDFRKGVILMKLDSWIPEIFREDELESAGNFKFTHLHVYYNIRVTTLAWNVVVARLNRIA